VIAAWVAGEVDHVRGGQVRRRGLTSTSELGARRCGIDAQRMGGDAVQLEVTSPSRPSAVLVDLERHHGERRPFRRQPRHPPRRPPAAIAARCDAHDPSITVVARARPHGAPRGGESLRGRAGPRPHGEFAGITASYKCQLI